MRMIGFDISRSVAEVAYLQDGTIRPGGRVGLKRCDLAKFASTLGSEGKNPSGRFPGLRRTAEWRRAVASNHLDVRAAWQPGTSAPGSVAQPGKCPAKMHRRSLAIVLPELSW